MTDIVETLALIFMYIIPCILGLFFHRKCRLISVFPEIFFPGLNFFNYAILHSIIDTHIESKGKCTKLGHTWHQFEDHKPTFRLSRGGITMRKCTVCEKFETSSWSAY